MKCEVFCSFSRIAFFVVFGCLFFLPTADASHTVALIYAGEKDCQLGLHGCGTEQAGGLSRRQTVIQSLLEKHPAPLNLHTANTLDPTNPNNELICQITLEALSAMHFDAVCLGPRELCIPIDLLSAPCANHPYLHVVCTDILVESPKLFSIAPHIIQKEAPQVKF